MKRRHFLSHSTTLAAGLATAHVLPSQSFASDAPDTQSSDVQSHAAPAAKHSDADMLRLARAALDRHASHILHRDIVGVVNFGLHSSKPRFQLVNLQQGRIDAFLVAHGYGSDPEQTGWLKRFSNAHGSNASSSGSYVTAEQYEGQYGNSRRLIGLDDENSEAYARAIVIHSASFVSAERAKKRDVGCSFGCFVFTKAEIDDVLQRLGPDRLLLAYKA